MNLQPLLKPSQKPRIRKPAVKVYPSGREVCSDTAAGKREYKRRTVEMFCRQKAICRWCEKFMLLEEATFDHDAGRGGGKQDDRIEVEGKPQNACLHWKCNSERASSHCLTRIEWLLWRRGAA